MNILFLTKSKEYTCRILKWFMEKHQVVYVVCKTYDTVEGTELWNICMNHHIQIIDNNEMYRLLDENKMPEIDLAISNTYGRLIKKSLLNWVKGNCINFHGAILPDYKGLFTYNHGILNGEKEWGCTVHYVNEKFDDGDIILIQRFEIQPDKISVDELEKRTQEIAYELTKKIVDMWEINGPLKGIPQRGRSNYYSKEDFENAKKVLITDTSDVVKRKIHAFWYPPYEGAYIEIDGTHFQLLPASNDGK